MLCRARERHFAGCVGRARRKYGRERVVAVRKSDFGREAEGEVV